MCSYYFSSVWVAEWPPFGKELLTRLTIYSLCSLTICNFSYFPFWFFLGWILVLIASVPDISVLVLQVLSSLMSFSQQVVSVRLFYLIKLVSRITIIC